MVALLQSFLQLDLEPLLVSRAYFGAFPPSAAPLEHAIFIKFACRQASRQFEWNHSHRCFSSLIAAAPSWALPHGSPSPDSNQPAVSRSVMRATVDRQRRPSRPSL